jgi:hypothetical protein
MSGECNLNLEGKKLLGRPSSRRKDNIKKDLIKWGLKIAFMYLRTETDSGLL